jgi:hypothetical protein
MQLAIGSRIREIVDNTQHAPRSVTCRAKSGGEFQVRETLRTTKYSTQSLLHLHRCGLYKMYKILDPPNLLYGDLVGKHVMVVH